MQMQEICQEYNLGPPKSYPGSVVCASNDEHKAALTEICPYSAENETCKDSGCFGQFSEIIGAICDLDANEMKDGTEKCIQEWLETLHDAEQPPVRVITLVTSHHIQLTQTSMMIVLDFDAWHVQLHFLL